MAYQTGTITNSHELGSIIYGFLIGMGWTRIATLNSDAVEPVGSDWVFRSSGRDGDKFINIRIASGISDTIASGDIQHPMEDGYTGYLNGFAYQYFTPDGTDPAVDGLGEIGRAGPLLYHANTESDNNYYEINLWQSDSGGSKVYRTVADAGFEQSGFTGFDGRRFLFQNTSSSAQRVDLHDGSITNISDSLTGDIQTAYARTNDGNEYLYTATLIPWYDQRIARYNIRTGGWSYVTGETLGSQSVSEYVSGPMCAGVKRKDRDVHWLYVFKGRDSKSWAMHNIETGTWLDPSGVLPPWNVGPPAGFTYSSEWACLLYVTKENSGYTYDRLYLTQSGGPLNGFASVSIDDYGYPISGSWATHSDLPSAGGLLYYGGIGLFELDGAIYLRRGSSNDDVARHLYKWEFPNDPSDSGSWVITKKFWHIGESSQVNTLFHTQNHLSTKVKVSEFETNTYWLFGTLDRLVVVVKDANGDYSYMYVGLFNPYANSTATYLLNDVEAGDTTVTVADPDLFEVGGKYLISETTGKVTTVSSNFTSKQLKLSASQIITVANKNGRDLIVSTLQYDFGAGSKIGEDPTPLMVSMRGKEHAQTLDNISLTNDDNFTDPPWQTYKLVPAVSLTFANATDNDDRAGTTYLFPMLLVQVGHTYVGKEVRGELIDVYVCGTSVASEEEISVGSKTYMAFDITDSAISQRLVIGPV